MSWFAASLVSTVKLKVGIQNSYPVSETVCLIEAVSFDEAEAKARALGELEASAGDDLTYCEQPAYREFLGIRKLKLTHNLEHDDEVGSARPSDGTEIIESYFEIKDETNLLAFAAGKRVTVDYVDDDE